MELKKIFRVNENYHASDSDVWQHWIDSNVISYHATEEGAKKKITNLLEKKMLTIPEIIENNPDSTYADECMDQYRRNYLTLDNNGNVDVPLFFHDAIFLKI